MNEKAQKPAKEKTKAVPPAVKRGPRDVDPTSKIKLGIDKDGKAFHATNNNPKREGTKAAERFALYKNGMTVAQAMEVGVKPRHLTKDVAKGFVTIESKAA